MNQNELRAHYFGGSGARARVWVFVLAGLALSIAGAVAAMTEWRFASQGVIAKARVVDRGEQAAGGKRAKTMLYWLRCSFQDASHQDFELQTDVDHEAWAAHPVDSTIDVVYVASDPATNRLAGQSQWLGPMAVVSGGLALLGFGLFDFIKRRSRASRSAAFILGGKAFAGRVTDVATDRKDKNSEYFVYYEFPVADGQLVSGRTEVPSVKVRHRWNHGDTIVVVVDPSDPSKHEADLFEARQNVAPAPVAS